MRSAPRRSYKWFSGDGDGQDAYISAISADPACARPLAAQLAVLIARKGRDEERENSERHQRIQARLNTLTSSLTTAAPSDDETPVLSGCVQLQANTTPEPVNELMTNITAAAAVSRECAPVRSDRVKVVNGVQGRVGNYYGIRRNSTGYDVLLNLNFSAAPGAALTTSPAQMRQRTIACLAEARPFLRNADGETLNIQLLSPEQLTVLPQDQRPPLHNINVVTGGRGNSANYVQDFDCSTILHEVLHLMGLCDEYPEGDNRLAGACRITRLPNTIMSLHTQAYAAGTNRRYQCSCDETCQLANSNPARWAYFNRPGLMDLQAQVGSRICTTIPTIAERSIPEAQALQRERIRPVSISDTNVRIESILPTKSSRAGSFIYVVQTYDCNCNDRSNPVDCSRKLQTLSRLVQNPSEMTTQVCPNNPDAPSTIVGEIPSDPAVVQNGSYYRYAPAASPSLLAPAHFARIVNGTCINNETRRYAECAEWAYRPRPKDSVCNPTPPATYDEATCRAQAQAETCSDRPTNCTPAYFLGL